METTDWDGYGTGNYEKCADCMVHCGFEATAVVDTGEASAEGAGRRAARRPHRGRDGPGDPARPPAAGRIRVLPPRREGDGAAPPSRRITRAGGEDAMDGGEGSQKKKGGEVGEVIKRWRW